MLEYFLRAEKQKTSALSETCTKLIGLGVCMLHGLVGGRVGYYGSLCDRTCCKRGRVGEINMCRAWAWWAGWVWQLLEILPGLGLSVFSICCLQRLTLVLDELEPEELEDVHMYVRTWKVFIHRLLT